MCIKIYKYLNAYRNKYLVDYCAKDGTDIQLFEFDEKEIFNTGDTGTSSFYKSDLRNILNEFNVFEKVQDKLNIEKKAFERMIIYAVEDFYEHEFKDDFSKKQYRNIINYNIKFTTYNEAKRFQRSEGWKKLNNNNNSNPYGFTEEEEEIFKELFKVGFTKLAKKYHPDVQGDNEKMKLLNNIKEKVKKCL